MRSFVLTYQREGHSIEIEGILFSNGNVALEFSPDNDWPGPWGFLSLASMEYRINEFGETSIKWLDDEEGEENDAIDALARALGHISPTGEVDR